MDILGFSVTGIAALFIAIGGAYFYDFFQTVAAAGTSASTSDLLRLNNSTMGMPIIVTLTIFGLGMLIIGGIFIASGHITEQLSVGNRGRQNLGAQTMADIRPSRMCIKCGSLLYQNSPYCPNCGNPAATPPKISS